MFTVDLNGTLKQFDVYKHIGPVDQVLSHLQADFSSLHKLCNLLDRFKSVKHCR